MSRKTIPFALPKMSRRGLIGALFTFLVAFAPSGNRIIFQQGSILGHAAEPGTVSLFGMQLVALAFVSLVFWDAGWNGLAKVMTRLPVAIFAACVGVLALLSSFQARDALAGLSFAMYPAIAIAVFVAILLFRPNQREVLVSFVGGAIFQTLIGGWQFFTQEAFASKWLGMAAHSADQLGAFVIETGSGRWLRAYGSLSHPNVFGLYVGIGLLMCVAMAAYRGHGKHARFYAFMPLIAAGLLFSFSRSAILATTAGFVWMVISAYASKAAPDYKRVLVPSFMVIMATVLVLGALYSEPIRTRATAEGRLEERSISERFDQYQDAMALFSRHSFTGVGIGQMPISLARESVGTREWWQYDYVHNVPMLIAVETGVVGLLAWVGVAWLSLLTIRDRLAHRSEGFSGATVYGAAFIALLVASMFDHFLWSSWFGQLLFWTVAGLLQAAYLDAKGE